MTLVEKGKGYRIFKDKLLGIIPFYTLEDTRDASQKGGVWYGVKFSKHYFKSFGTRTIDNSNTFLPWILIFLVLSEYFTLPFISKIFVSLL